MKCPNKKAGLPETAPFPHEYALDAEYLLKMMEYNMRVYMLAMIEATARVDREFIVTPRQALACAMQVECELVAKEVGSHLVQDIELVTLLRKLNIHTT